MVQNHREIEHGRPDIVVIEKVSGKCLIIDIEVPCDHNAQQKEVEKIADYQEPRIDVARLRNRDSYSKFEEKLESNWNNRRHTMPAEISSLGRSKKSEKNSLYFTE